MNAGAGSDEIAGERPSIGEGRSGELGRPSLLSLPALKGLPGPWARDPSDPALIISVPTGLPVMVTRSDDATTALGMAAPKLYDVLLGCALALRSYQHGNSATDLARDLADAAELVLADARGEIL